MPFKILCVAEKPSIAKAVAEHLSGGQLQIRNAQGAPGYIKNYEFDFNFGRPWGHCPVVMTSVIGHLTNTEFDQEYLHDWKYPPPDRLFDGRIYTKIDPDKETIAANISRQARGAKVLFIWTDCDREGEHIGGEVRTVALEGNRNIEVKRAKFSNIERAHVINAAKNPVNLDERQVDAVTARTELDLRIGYAFSRLQSNNLKSLGGPLSDATLSYGSCQFPTLGFVVDRYFKVKNFVPEPFWSIKINHKKDDIDVVFLWKRNRLFDRAVVTMIFERCLQAKSARVLRVQQKPTKKWKPLPLTTVELQKVAARLMGMNSQNAMKAAESLYNKGFISYPRTETDRFDRGMDLRSLVAKQTVDNRWGPFAQGLLDGRFQQPRDGRNDDQAHPPIHPVTGGAAAAFADQDERRLYEFIVRRFLACCSQDALGTATDVEIGFGEEIFHAHGLVVLARNYLDVYPYEKWTTSEPMPNFTVGEAFEPLGANLTDGKTTRPAYLTESDLIALMDANGIGTDATMAEHIGKVKQRVYVVTQPRGGAAPNGNIVEEFIPTTLGVALVVGYDNIGFGTSLSKPHLRKEMELRMKEVCEGRKTKQEFVRESIRQYKEVYYKAEEEIGSLKAACRRYIFNNVVNPR